MDRTFGWDLPPGVRVSDIPGNRPEDEMWEKIIDNFFDKDRIKKHKGFVISEEEMKLMDELYNSDKFSSTVDSYIAQAIEYGMELGRKEQIAVQKENEEYDKYHKEEEDRLRVQEINEETVKGE